MRMRSEPRQLGRDQSRRHHEVHAARVERAARHAVMLGGVVLHESDPALSLDRLQAERPVGPGPRQNHADGLTVSRDRQRLQEHIHRQMQSGSQSAWSQPQSIPLDHHVRVRRDDVDVIRLQLSPIAHFAHHHRREVRQNLGHRTLVVGVQMRDDNKRQPAPRSHRAKQLGQRFESPRRSADPHDRKQRDVCTARPRWNPNSRGS